MKKSEPVKSKKPNDQNEELYLLKTGTVLSVVDSQLKGVYNDGSEWKFKSPPEVNLYPNAKVKLYRYHLDNHPEVSHMLVIMDPQLTYHFVIGDTDTGEQLIQYGVSRTIDEMFFKAER